MLLESKARQCLWLKQLTPICSISPAAPLLLPACPQPPSSHAQAGYWCSQGLSTGTAVSTPDIFSTIRGHCRIGFYPSPWSGWFIAMVGVGEDATKVEVAGGAGRLRSALLACSHPALDTEGDVLVPFQSLVSQHVALVNGRLEGARAGCVSYGFANTGGAAFPRLCSAARCALSILLMQSYRQSLCA